MPVKLPQGVSYPSNQVPPSVCPVSIDWNIYWQLAGNPANVAVSLNLQAASVQASILDRIASVKIDNTGSPNSVYVQFADTGDVVNCPPNCTVTFPCLTNLLNANIIVLGLTQGFIPTTKLFFYNIALPPSVDYEISATQTLYKASPTIQRGNTIFNTNYEIPALGDQFFTSSQIHLANIGETVPLFNSPYPSGYIYLTSLQIYVVISYLINPGVNIGVLDVESTGVGGVLTVVPFAAIGSASNQFGTQTPLSMSGMNVKLDATQSWRMRVITPVDVGVAVLNAAFTQSPV